MVGGASIERPEVKFLDSLKTNLCESIQANPNTLTPNNPQTFPTKAINPTTSFLTAATLTYATGAGITAAAGTRLALQLFLDKGFKLFSFQLAEP